MRMSRRTGRGVGQRGMVTVILLVLVLLVAVYVRLNTAALSQMKREVERVSQASEVSRAVESADGR